MISLSEDCKKYQLTANVKRDLCNKGRLPLPKGWSLATLGKASFYLPDTPQEQTPELVSVDFVSGGLSVSCAVQIQEHGFTHCLTHAASLFRYKGKTAHKGTPSTVLGTTRTGLYLVTELHALTELAGSSSIVFDWCLNCEGLLHAYTARAQFLWTNEQNLRDHLIVSRAFINSFRLSPF